MSSQSLECERSTLSLPPARDGASRDWEIALARVCQLTDDQLAKLDIAALNLFVAAGLPGTENLDPGACLQKVDLWTHQVRRFTEANWPRFLRSPGDYASAGAFKTLAMVTVVARDLGVRYNLAFSEGDYNPSDPRNLFLHGMLTGHGGTCVTMPLLYIAIGRRLGYPLHLVMAKEHYFVRWEGGEERFNIEATSPGFDPVDDEYFRTHPRPLTKADDAEGVYLRNFRPREVLASFLTQRGMCLLYNLRIPDALSAFERATTLAVKVPGASIGRIACSALLDGILHAERKALAAGRRTIDMRDLKLPQPVGNEKRRVNWMAMETLQAILRLQTADPILPLPI